MYGMGGWQGATFVKQTNDGGYIMTGYTRGNLPPTAMYIVKTNAYGGLLWSKSYNDILDCQVNYLLELPDGGFIITRYTQTDCYRIYLSKIDSLGNTLWEKTYSRNAHETGQCVIHTTDNGFLIISRTDSPTTAQDLMVVKTDSTGNMLWSKVYEGGVYEGGDDGNILEMSDGYMICSERTVSKRDVYLLKIDFNGHVQWSKTFDTGEHDYFTRFIKTSDGNLVLLGYIDAFPVLPHPFLLKMDPSGTILWSKKYETGFNTSPADIKETLNGELAITGSIWDAASGTYNSHFLKTDSLGNLLHSKTYGTLTNTMSIDNTADGGFVIAGVKTIGSGDTDCYLVKTNSSGNSGCDQADISVNIQPISFVTTNVITTQVNEGSQYPFTTTIGEGGNETTLCFSLNNIQDEIPETILLAYPNPFSSYATIEFDIDLMPEKLVLFNAVGAQVVDLNEINENKITFQRGNLPNGVYYLCAYKDGLRAQPFKLIISD